MVLKETGSQKLIPVRTNFAYQRFEDYQPAVEDIREVAGRSELARKIESLSDHGGYVQMRRDVLGALYDLQCPNAVNMYVFLLLIAAYSGPAEGTSFWSRAKMGSCLGLTEKQIRNAEEALFRSGLVERAGRKNRAIVLKVTDWKGEQDPKVPGYFKLFKSLRDTCRSDLLGSPGLFRTWLHCLMEARIFEQEAEELAPGEFRVRPERAAERLLIDASRYWQHMEQLRERGSLHWTQKVPEKIKVTNWLTYQREVYGRRADTGQGEGKYAAESG